MPVDPNPGITASATQQESHVLNDAVLKAALDLAKRPRERRKVIFIISDGREYRSNASYRDVLKVLLSNNITVYAIGVGGRFRFIARLKSCIFRASDIATFFPNMPAQPAEKYLTS
jgi:ATP-dependent protease HslVU (ClpYQ) peptidase subunit